MILREIKMVLPTIVPNLLWHQNVEQEVVDYYDKKI